MIIIVFVIVLVILVPILYIPYKIANNKEQLVNKLFALDISSNNNNYGHIRITEEGILFKYKNVIKYYYVFPRVFSSISLKGKAWETPTYEIFSKTQLSVNEQNNIIDRITELNNCIDGDITVNYKGNKKLVHCSDINKIFEKYSIKF